MKTKLGAALVMLSSILITHADAQTLVTPRKLENSESRRALEGMVEEAKDALKGLERQQSEKRVERGPEDRDTRIVNGIGTVAYPAVGALLKGDNADVAKAWCTGTLIACDKFLTAAHCVAKDPNPRKYFAFLHSAGILKVVDIAWQKDKYSFPDADVAILTLANIVEHITPEKLNRSGRPIDQTEGTILGFGRTGGSHYDYGVKRLGYVQTAACQRSNDNLVCWNFDAQVQPRKNSNTCNADSGGPLFVEEIIGGKVDRVIVGTTSGGMREDCLLGDHSYDANVFQYIKWIDGVAKLDPPVVACGDGPAVDTDNDVLSGVASLDESKTSVSYEITTTEDVTQLMIAMNGDDDGYGHTDFNLYVIPGKDKDISHAKCKADGVGQFGFCRINAPGALDWTVVVTRKAGRGMVQVVITQLSKHR